MTLRYGLIGWFVMDFQRFIISNKKLYILIIYIVLGLAPWPPSGGRAYPPRRPQW